MAKAGRYIPLGVLGLVFLALFLPPFLNVNRYRATITNSLSNAVGRPVKVGSIALRLVPQPGFDLENISIGDDPSISAEPILRAEEVTAYLRLSSLWRGQLEIAKLSLRYPSLNIVRTSDGRVNLESLLWQASRTPVAPTSQRRPEARTRFPYIEAEDGRVNFRNGLDKSVFSFNEADFALWSPAENEWRMRLEAKPMRTDTKITDTGVIKAEATFHRAEQLRDIPVQGRIQWHYGQLGQLTKLSYGRDRGWRGGLGFEAQFSGTPAELHVVSDAAITDFRRFDITDVDSLLLQAHCNGVIAIPSSSVPGFDCKLPLGKGVVNIAGSLGQLASTYDLSVAAENIPIDDLLVIVRHTKRGLPRDLTGQGSLSAAMTLRRTGVATAEFQCAGTGTGNGIVLGSNVLEKPLKVDHLQFVLTNPGESIASSEPRPKPGKRHVTAKPATTEVAGAFLHILPMELGTAPYKTRVSGSVSDSEYSLKVAGAGTLERFMQVARGLGVGVPRINLLGKADFDLDVHGPWAGLPDPSIQGTAKVNDAKAEIPGFNSPVELASATVDFTGAQFALSQITGKAGKLKFGGNAEFRRSCEDTNCYAKIDLRFDDLDVDQLDALVNPRRKSRPWYRFFGSRDEESALPALNASGRITADKLTLGTLVAAHFNSEFKLHGGELKLEAVRSDLLGGSHQSDWQIDFKGKAPRYAGTGTVKHVNLSQLATLAKQPLGAGTLDANFELKFEGWTGSDIADSAAASADFTWANGVLRTISLPGHSPWIMSSFWGKAVYERGTVRFENCRMTTPSGSYAVSGTSSSAYELALQLHPERGSSFELSGTLTKPELKVVPLPAATSGTHVPSATPATSARR